MRCLASISARKCWAALGLLLAPFWVIAQGCDQPLNLCSGAGSQSVSDSVGQPVPLPSSFCFSSENTVFLSFTTVDPSQVSGQTFSSSSTAVISMQFNNCSGDSATAAQGLNLAVFTASDPCDDQTYNSPIDCETSLTDSAHLELSNLQPGTTYYIAVSGSPPVPPATSPANCDISASISGDAVQYDPGVQPRFQNIIAGQTADIAANTGFDSYSWTGEALSNNNQANTSASPNQLNQDFIYNLQTQINGCTFQDQVTVHVRPAIVPYNTFTPNNDGVNDTWKIEGIENWPNAQIQVFSRWGQRVYHSTHYNNDWTGDGLPPATYYYVIEINPLDFNAAPYTGSITIVY